jgi:hypothetical protein
VTKPLAGIRTVGTWPLLFSAAVFSVSLGVALREGLRHTQGTLIYALDDSYIHMAVARNFAEAGVWGCTPFHFSSSSSSPLWTFGLAAAYRVFGVHEWMPLVLNIAAALATLLVAERSLARLGVQPLVRGAALVGIVIAFPFAGIALIGMEHTLHLLLTIAFGAVAVTALTAPVSGPAQVERRRVAGLCALAALLVASRYEGIFMVGLACLALLARRRLLPAVAIGLAALLPVAAMGGFSVANGWYFLPNPLMVKAVGENTSTLAALLKPFGSEDLEFLRNNRAMPILLGLAVLAAAAQWRARLEPWRAPLLFALLLGAMILLHGHFVFSPLYWAYRYDAYLVGFGVFVAAVVLAQLPRLAAQPRGAAAALLVALLVPFVSDVREGLVASAEIEGMRGTFLEQYQTARFIRLYGPNDTVIVNDLGAVTYYTGARILDVVGLGDIEPVAIMRRAAYGSPDVIAWTAPYRPRFAIFSLGWSYVVPLIPPEWPMVAEVEMPPHRHRVGFFAVDPSAAWPLRAAVAQHYGGFPAELGYRVKLLPPEAMPASPPTALSASAR